MPWNEFLTYAAQIVIAVVIVTVAVIVIGALVVSIAREIRKTGRW